MSQYKYYFRYGMIESWIETLLYQIGASASLAYADIQTHDNTNSLYVSWTGEDSTNNDGTQELPYRTIQYAKDMMDSNHNIITIMDSNYYYTGDAVNLYFDVWGFILQGMEGQKPILILDPLIASQERMIRLQGTGKLINVEIQIPDGYATQVIGVEAYDGTMKYVTITNADKNALSKLTSGTLDMTGCILKNSRNEGVTDGSGISITEGIINLDYCLINDNGYCGILATGALTKEINLNYCTITNNQYGINVSSCSNLSLTITNTINYRNRIYDHYGDLGTYSYSCVGKIQGSPTLTPATNIIRVNPLFVSIDDFRIRTKYNGYADMIMQSPCIGISSEYNDIGCYQYTRALSGQTYNELEMPSPDRVGKSRMAVDGKLITTIALAMKLIKRGTKNKLELGWTGNDNVLTEAQITSLEMMFDNEVNEIYLSVDNKATFKKYTYDKTRDFSTSRALNVIENTYHVDVTLNLIEV
jgi:hypothetical protein